MLRGEVWWVNFDPSIGGEVQKTRPAVIVSNNPRDALPTGAFIALALASE